MIDVGLSETAIDDENSIRKDMPFWLNALPERRSMLLLRQFLALLKILFAPRSEIVLENIALRQQISVLSRRSKRPRLRCRDRVFWVWLSRLWARWRSSLIIVKPDTVARWHRQGWHLYWRWKSRRKSGRPRSDAELRELIQTMVRENPLWGAPRIHGELLMLGFVVSQTTVAKYMPKRDADHPR